MCGNFEGEVKGDPALAVWCHCETCRKATGAAMQLAIFKEFQILKGGGDDLIAFKKDPSSETTRYACKKCGSFCYKVLGGGGGNVAPLGALKGGGVVKPTCHIFVADKGDQAIMFPELPQHDGFP